MRRAASAKAQAVLSATSAYRVRVACLPVSWKLECALGDDEADCMRSSALACGVMRENRERQVRRTRNRLLWPHAQVDES